MVSSPGDRWQLYLEAQGEGRVGVQLQRLDAAQAGRPRRMAADGEFLGAASRRPGQLMA